MQGNSRWIWRGTALWPTVNRTELWEVTNGNAICLRYPKKTSPNETIWDAQQSILLTTTIYHHRISSWLVMNGHTHALWLCRWHHIVFTTREVPHMGISVFTHGAQRDAQQLTSIHTEDISETILKHRKRERNSINVSVYMYFAWRKTV